MMLVYLAGVLSIVPNAPSGDQLLEDLAAVETAKVDAIPLEVSQCVADKIRGYEPRDDEKGNTEKAEIFLKASLGDCRLDDALVKVRAGLMATTPTASEGDLDRQQAAAFAFPTLFMMMAVNQAFEIKTKRAVPERQVEIPAPEQ